ncbi:MAG: tRNA (uridine(34)/cytosine(34)/5-carboxymethylaminomethyluridine(34)-2'-O)-methyltransferase TrmL [Clostridiales bacterium]|nr:tRNA (uridine(34)/cytosine(34)/5-carboxymethylaminomethyluridine(34)-2'-O)-methyltransferase TrmL [Clostridiales bacterium]
MTFEIVLVEPEIPPNTGNIARSCATTGSVLHLVRPLGFSLDEKSLKRAGLDYWPFVKLVIHENFASFMGAYGKRRMHIVTTKGNKNYTEASYEDGDMLIFGKETEGLPARFIEENKEKTIRIPMRPQTALRSLNLANSVSIVLFEALRQTGFSGLK